jgi:hypothetical protein
MKHATRNKHSKQTCPVLLVLKRAVDDVETGLDPADPRAAIHSVYGTMLQENQYERWVNNAVSINHIAPSLVQELDGCNPVLANGLLN